MVEGVGEHRPTTFVESGAVFSSETWYRLPIWMVWRPWKSQFTIESKS